MSAKRKDNAEVFVPSKPEPSLNPQPPTVFPDQERVCSSKTPGGPESGWDWVWVTLCGLSRCADFGTPPDPGQS